MRKLNILPLSFQCDSLSGFGRGSDDELLEEVGGCGNNGVTLKVVGGGENNSVTLKVVRGGGTTAITKVARRGKLVVSMLGTESKMNALFTLDLFCLFPSCLLNIIYQHVSRSDPWQFLMGEKSLIRSIPLSLPFLLVLFVVNRESSFVFYLSFLSPLLSSGYLINLGLAYSAPLPVGYIYRRLHKNSTSSYRYYLAQSGDFEAMSHLSYHLSYFSLTFNLSLLYTFGLVVTFLVYFTRRGRQFF